MGDSGKERRRKKGRVDYREKEEGREKRGRREGEAPAND